MTVDVDQIDSVEQLDDLSADDLWYVAGSRNVEADIRHAAMQRWLYPDETEDELSEERLEQLEARAEKVDDSEAEQESEDGEHQGIYFDDEGRIIVEYNGVSYALEPSGDRGSLNGLLKVSLAPL